MKPKLTVPHRKPSAHSRKSRRLEVAHSHSLPLRPGRVVACAVCGTYITTTAQDVAGQPYTCPEHKD